MYCTVQDIKDAVCKVFNLPPEQLINHDRHRSLVLARHIAMWLCRQRTDASYPEIGKAFGGRDHTTVISAVRRININLTLKERERLVACVKELDRLDDPPVTKYRVEDSGAA